MLNIDIAFQTCHDKREDVCRLGEAAIPLALESYDSQTRDSHKETILTFIQLQLVIHHPNGASTKSEGTSMSIQSIVYVTLLQLIP